MTQTTQTAQTADPYAGIATPTPAASLASATPPAATATADDPYAAIATPTPPAAAPGTTGVGRFINQIGEGGAEAAKDIYGAATQTGQDLLSGKAAVNAVKGVWDSLPPVELANSVKQTLPLLDAYEKSRASGASISDSIKAADVAARQHAGNIQPIQSAVDAFKANPTRETARALTDATAVAASLLVGGEAAAPEEAEVVAPAAAAPTEVKAATAVPRVNPFRRAVTNPIANSEEAGAAAAQPIAQAGVRAAAPTVGSSLRSGIDVETPFKAAKALYRTVDEASKTNFQDLYAKLDAAQDDARLAASGSPEEAKAQLNIKNTQDAIDDAKSVAAKSGVPDVDKMLAQADAKFAETQANKDFNRQFFGNQGVISGNVAHGVPEKINVDSALKTLENLDKPNKYGISRLQQTSLGKDGAFNLKQYLYNAQRAGQEALNARVLRNKILGWSSVATGLVEGARLALK